MPGAAADRAADHDGLRAGLRIALVDHGVRRVEQRDVGRGARGDAARLLRRRLREAERVVRLVPDLPVPDPRQRQRRDGRLLRGERAAVALHERRHELPERGRARHRHEQDAALVLARPVRRAPDVVDDGALGERGPRGAVADVLVEDAPVVGGVVRVGGVPGLVARDVLPGDLRPDDRHLVLLDAAPEERRRAVLLRNVRDADPQLGGCRGRQCTADDRGSAERGQVPSLHVQEVLPISSCRADRSSRRRSPSARVTVGSQPRRFLARVMSGRRCVGSFSGSDSYTIRLLGAGRLDHLRGELEERELLGIAEVDGVVLTGQREPPDPGDEVVDVTERAGLRPVAEHRQRLAEERLPEEGRDRPAVEGAHPRPVRVEDADDRGVDALLTVVGHRQGLGVPLRLVVHAARADRVDVPPVALGLRVLERVAVHLAGGGEDEPRALELREPERVVRAVRADLQRVQRQAQVVDRAGRRGEVEDEVHGLGKLDVRGHVVVHERERVIADVLDVREGSGVEVIDADHPMPLREQMLTQVRPEETSASGHHGGRHQKHSRPRPAGRDPVRAQPLRSVDAFPSPVATQFDPDSNLAPARADMGAGDERRRSARRNTHGERDADGAGRRGA